MFGNVVQSFGIDVNTLPVVLNLVAWFDAADDNTITKAGAPETVSQWDDKSGNGHNATQGTASLQPEFVTDAANGLPVLRFDGSDDILNLPSVVITGTVARTFFLVCRGDTSTDGGMVSLTTSAGAGELYVVTDEVALRVISGNRIFVEDTVDPTTYFVLTIQNAASSTVEDTLGRRDGVVMTEASATPEPIDTGSAGTTSFGPLPGSNFYDGDLAEVIMYDRDLSESEMQSVERYLGVKWGISVA